MKKEDVSGLIVYLLIFGFAIIFGFTVLRDFASNCGLSTGVFFGYIIGVIVAVIAAAGKELYDKVTGTGTPEVLDFVATIAGAAAAVIASVVLSSLYYCVFGT
jgi:hypothetical protein